MRTVLALSTLALAAFVSVTNAAEPAADYRPESRLSGTLRVSGNDQMAPLMARWAADFRRFHPELRIETWLKGSGSGMYGLEMRTADVALMGRPINPYERYGVYERAWVYPVEIEVATGAAATPHKSPAYAVFVHKDNPLTRLTVAQLDGIFGAQRGGGWKALTWDETAAHTKAQDIRTWRQAGVSGALATHAIHVYGPPNLGAGTITYFQTRVMGGGAIFNEDLREYADRARMMADVARDPDGIAYGPLGVPHPGLKVVAVGDGDAGPFVVPDKRTVGERRYPLSRPVYLYYTIDNDRTEIANPRVDPKVREFVRYVLSRQGQQAVARDADYLPLPSDVAREQRARLDFDGVPPERKLLKDDD